MSLEKAASRGNCCPHHLGRGWGYRMVVIGKIWGCGWGWAPFSSTLRIGIATITRGSPFSLTMRARVSGLVVIVIVGVLQVMVAVDAGAGGDLYCCD